jgi:hypothetical protein
MCRTPWIENVTQLPDILCNNLMIFNPRLLEHNIGECYRICLASANLCPCCTGCMAEVIFLNIFWASVSWMQHSSPTWCSSSLCFHAPSLGTCVQQFQLSEQTWWVEWLRSFLIITSPGILWRADVLCCPFWMTSIYNLSPNYKFTDLHHLGKSALAYGHQETILIHECLIRGRADREIRPHGDLLTLCLHILINNANTC